MFWGFLSCQRLPREHRDVSTALDISRAKPHLHHPFALSMPPPCFCLLLWHARGWLLLMSPLLLCLCYCCICQAAENKSAGRHLRSQVVVDADIAKVISKVRHTPGPAVSLA